MKTHGDTITLPIEQGIAALVSLCYRLKRQKEDMQRMERNTIETGVHGEDLYLGHILALETVWEWVPIHHLVQGSGGTENHVVMNSL